MPPITLQRRTLSTAVARGSLIIHEAPAYLGPNRFSGVANEITRILQCDTEANLTTWVIVLLNALQTGVFHIKHEQLEGNVHCGNRAPRRSSSLDNHTESSPRKCIPKRSHDHVNGEVIPQHVLHQRGSPLEAGTALEEGPS